MNAKARMALVLLALGSAAGPPPQARASNPPQVDALPAITEPAGQVPAPAGQAEGYLRFRVGSALLEVPLRYLTRNDWSFLPPGSVLRFMPLQFYLFWPGLLANQHPATQACLEASQAGQPCRNFVGASLHTADHLFFGPNERVSDMATPSRNMFGVLARLDRVGVVFYHQRDEENFVLVFETPRAQGFCLVNDRVTPANWGNRPDDYARRLAGRQCKVTNLRFLRDMRLTFIFDGSLIEQADDILSDLEHLIQEFLR